jgi:hypothetical protein
MQSSGWDDGQMVYGAEMSSQEQAQVPALGVGWQIRNCLG